MTRSAILILAGFCSLMICLGSCQPEQETTSGNYRMLQGQTMGTTYHIHYRDTMDTSIQPSIDSLLVSINNIVSTYEDLSLITRLNKNILMIDSADRKIVQRGRRNMHFESNFMTAMDIFRDTEGAFDPTVMPLVNYWGFGYTPKLAVTEVDSSQIGLILKEIGMDKWSYRPEGQEFILVKPALSELDFSAIAKGYAVDYLASYLDSLGIRHYMVEIGGEVFAKGVNAKGKRWSIGLNTPREDAAYNDLELVISFTDKGLASSGNYRNFHVVDGIKYGHEINPDTGFPEISNLLAVSVIADDCMKADAYATAYMVMGLEKAMAHVNKTRDLEASFFYGDKDGNIGHAFSDGFEAFLPAEEE